MLSWDTLVKNILGVLLWFIHACLRIHWILHSHYLKVPKRLLPQIAAKAPPWSCRLQPSFHLTEQNGWIFRKDNGMGQNHAKATHATRFSIADALITVVSRTSFFARFYRKIIIYICFSEHSSSFHITYFNDWFVLLAYWLCCFLNLVWISH